jgi:exosortase
MNLIGPRHALFGVSVAALLAAQAGTLGALTALSRNDSTASHHVLIPFVVLVLVFQQRRSIFSSVRTGATAGLGVVLVGLALGWFGRSYSSSMSEHDTLSVAVTALVLMCVGGFLSVYGPDASRAALFPLVFLGFAIPIPDGLLYAATQFLKTGSAETVAGLFTLTGTPYHRQAFVFSLPTFAIEIADECSGIRSSIALLLTGLLAGHMFLRSGWKKALLVAVIIPLAMLKNGIRIVALSLLAMHVDPSFLTGQLHHEGGIVFFLVALAFLSPLFLILCKSDGQPQCN